MGNPQMSKPKSHFWWIFKVVFSPQTAWRQKPVFWFKRFGVQIPTISRSFGAIRSHPWWCDSLLPCLRMMTCRPKVILFWSSQGSLSRAVKAVKVFLKPSTHLGFVRIPCGETPTLRDLRLSPSLPATTIARLDNRIRGIQQLNVIKKGGHDKTSCLLTLGYLRIYSVSHQMDTYGHLLLMKNWMSWIDEGFRIRTWSSKTCNPWFFSAKIWSTQTHTSPTCIISPKGFKPTHVGNFRFFWKAKPLKIMGFFPSLPSIFSWWFEKPTHLKNMPLKIGSFHQVWVKIKHIWVAI